MQANLGDRPGDGLQHLIEPVDVMGRRARLGLGPDSCFQHVSTVPAAPGTTVILLVAGLDARILGLDGSPLRHLTLDPSVDSGST